MQRILTFDCYGTLLDTEPVLAYVNDEAEKRGVCGEAACRVFSAYEDRLMYGGPFLPFETLLREVLSYCDMELNTDFFVAGYAGLAEVYRNLSPFGDVRGALAEFKAKGFEIAVMSNSSKDFMRRHMEKMGTVFDGVLLADDVHCYKPKLDFFSAAEDAFGLKRKKHAHVAKGYWWDIVPAAKMGWRKIWLNRDGLCGGRREEMPYLTVSSMDELAALL